MEAEIYRQMASLEDRHWWFIGRRCICRKLLNTLKLTRHIRVLEAGCGSGGNLALLAEFGKVHAFEPYGIAREHAIVRGIGEIAEGSLPHEIPYFDNAHFDLVCMFDVLEHVEDDRAALKALHNRMTMQSTLLLTVPAFPALWSEHDVKHHHKRRYTARGLKRLLDETGFDVAYISHCNFFLFPAALLARLGGKFMPRSVREADAHVPAPILNKTLATLFSMESYLMPYIRFPFGLSIVALAHKRTLMHDIGYMTHPK